MALPVVVFRGYAKAWLRGGIGLLGLLALMALGGVTDLIWFALTAGFSAGLVVSGFLAGEVAEGMRDRETVGIPGGDPALGGGRHRLHHRVLRVRARPDQPDCGAVGKPHRVRWRRRRRRRRAGHARAGQEPDGGPERGQIRPRQMPTGSNCIGTSTRISSLGARRGCELRLIRHLDRVARR